MSYRVIESLSYCARARDIKRGDQILSPPPPPPLSYSDYISNTVSTLVEYDDRTAGRCILHSSLRVGTGGGRGEEDQELEA